MTAANLPTPLTGVGVTAIGVALIRARESARPDRLLDDPYARLFADAARERFLGPAAPPGAAEAWANVERLVESFYEGRIVGVRLFDDRVREAVGAGCEQVVQLGAGLDTRAYRLGLPAGVRAFELDTPAMFEFKEPLLAAAGATPSCGREVVPADLREDWAGALIAHGFRADLPTAWVEEGVLGYLPREQARAVAVTAGELSAPGSRFIAGRIAAARSASHYRDLRQLVSGGQDGARPETGLGPDAARWLDGQGWRTTFLGWDELAGALDRPVATGNPENGFVVAVRE